jgi:hypothetical protein
MDPAFYTDRKFNRPSANITTVGPSVKRADSHFRKLVCASQPGADAIAERFQLLAP